MPQLSWHDPRRGAQSLELEGEVLVGRSPNCQVVLTSGTTSRSHARLCKRDGEWWIEDLGSLHGTMINGDEATEACLKDGDRIHVGDAVLVYSIRDTATPSHRITERSLDQIDLIEGLSSRVDTSQRHLEELVRLGDGLRRCTTPAEVATALLQRAFEATGAERGLVVCTWRGPEEVLAAAGAGDVRPSRTFVERVLASRVGLVVDATRDRELAVAESVVCQHIRSILCVPLWDGARVSGYAYLDATLADFVERDLDLLMVMAYHAAAEIARLRLLEQQRLLEQFLPKNITRKLISERGTEALETQESVAVLVHVESIGISDLTSRLEAQEVQRFLDVHLSRLVAIAVDRHGGTLHRITDSGMRVAFGVPFSREIGEEALAALTAALEMRDEVEALREDDPAYASVRLRVGVHAGKVVAGMMGPERRQEYSVMGAAVEDAARVTLSCPPGRVLATTECLEVAPGGAFEVVPATERKLQLAAGPARCWWVVRQVEPSVS